MDHRVIMHVRENAVAPHLPPTVLLEGLLDHLFRVGRARKVYDAAVIKQRQARIVWDCPVVGKHEGKRFDRLGRGHHQSSRTFTPRAFRALPASTIFAPAFSLSDVPLGANHRRLAAGATYQPADW